MKGEKIIIFILVVAGVGLLIWSVTNAVSQERVTATLSSERYAQAVSDELPDKCKTPPGYTDEDWQEHMSHHPDRYQECFNGGAAEQPPVVAQQAFGYRDITPQQLATGLDLEQVTIVDTHIPEQAHIPGTDAFIPYDEIASRLGDLPDDKNAAIALYCRSGNMSEQAAKTLVELGYTNVYNLAGGTNAWTAAGYELEEVTL